MLNHNSHNSNSRLILVSLNLESCLLVGEVIMVPHLPEEYWPINSISIGIVKEEHINQTSMDLSLNAVLSRSEHAVVKKFLYHSKMSYQWLIHVTLS